MGRSYSTVYLLPLILLHCAYCNIQSSQEFQTVCLGETVVVRCTIVAQTHHWRVPNLDIARSLSVRDWNRNVRPDPPFQFAVTHVIQNGSNTVITSSTAVVIFTEDLNGVNVSCWDGNRWPIEDKDIQRTTIMQKAPPGAPRTQSVTFPIPGQFKFTWDPRLDVDAYLINISGPDDQCGSRNTPHRSTENSYTCSGWSPTGQKYSLSVRATNCGGEGPESDLVIVCLQKPSPPRVTTTPLYGLSGHLLEIESHAVVGDPVFIAAGVDNSPSEYIFIYDSGSESLNFTQQCTGGSCQHTFRVNSSSQVQQYRVSVAIRNVVGVGTASVPVPIGLTNEVLAVRPDICNPKIICQFLNGPIASASCEISFSTGPTSTNLTNVDSANGMNITNVTVPLSPELQPNTLYYYDVLAVGDSMRMRMKGTFKTMTDGLCEGTPQPPTSGLGYTIGIGVALVTAVLVGIMLCICCCNRTRVAKKSIDVENAQLQIDGLAEENLLPPHLQLLPPHSLREQEAASIPLLPVLQDAHTTPEKLPVPGEHPPTPEEHPSALEKHPAPEEYPTQEENPPAPEEHPHAKEKHLAQEEHPSAPEKLLAPGEHPPAPEEHPLAKEKHLAQEEHPSAPEKLLVPGEHPPAPEEHPAHPAPEEYPTQEENPPAPEEHPHAIEKHLAHVHEEHPSALEKHPVPEEHPSAQEEYPAHPAPEELPPPENRSPPEGLYNAAQNGIPSPPSPPPVTETSLPESPAASSQKYPTHIKQLAEILEARDKERVQAPVQNEVSFASLEPCVRPQQHPGTVKETQESGPGLNDGPSAQVLQPSFSSGVVYRLLSISGQEPSTGEASFINNAVMETQGAAKSEVVNQVRLTARTPAGQSLGRNLEGSPNQSESGGIIPNLSPFPIHGEQREELGPQVTPKHHPAVSGLIVPLVPEEHNEPDEHSLAPEEHQTSDEHPPVPEEHPPAPEEHPPALEEHTGPEEHPTPHS